MSEQSREDFENYCRTHLGWHEGRLERHAGQYINGKTFEYYTVWKASRDYLHARVKSKVQERKQS